MLSFNFGLFDFLFSVNLYCCLVQIVALANLMPADDSVDELDSYMYQTVSLLVFFLMQNWTDTSLTILKQMVDLIFDNQLSFFFIM